MDILVQTRVASAVPAPMPVATPVWLLVSPPMEDTVVTLVPTDPVLVVTLDLLALVLDTLVRMDTPATKVLTLELAREDWEDELDLQALATVTTVVLLLATMVELQGVHLGTTVELPGVHLATTVVLLATTVLLDVEATMGELVGVVVTTARTISQ